MIDKIYIILTIIMFVGLLVVGLGFKPYMEARTFNKFSQDKKATFWDALWAELRIEGCR